MTDIPIDAAEEEVEATTAPMAGRTAWARNLEAPLRDFLRTQSGSAVILLAGAIAALLWVNIDQTSYENVWTTVLSITVGSAGISQDLRHWVNDGLMTFFFFVVGLKRGASSTSATCVTGAVWCCRCSPGWAGWSCRS